MPSFLCKHCASTNQVPPDAIQFTCKICGTVQDVPALNETVDDLSLNDMVLNQIPAENPESKFIFKQFAAFEGIDETTGEQEDDETAHKNGVYYSALSKMGGDDIRLYTDALDELETIRGWKDTDELIVECANKIEQLLEEDRRRKATAEREKKARKILLRIGLPAFAALIAAALVFTFSIYPKLRYNKAVALSESGDAVQAYNIFSSLKDYKDSPQKTAALFEEYKKQSIKTATVGDTIYFGSYEQDNNPANGKEDIAWKVLDKDGDKLFVISQYGLDMHKYHGEKVDITWEHCAMRKWLNTEFAESAFTEQERAQIIPSVVSADENPNFETSPGNPTEDKIFLLSIPEAERYLKTDSDKVLLVSDYAVARGAYRSYRKYSVGHSTCWFLRTPGFESTQIAYVYYDGTIKYYGTNVNAKGASTRPAMWISTGN